MTLSSLIKATLVLPRDKNPPYWTCWGEVGRLVGGVIIAGFTGDDFFEEMLGDGPSAGSEHTALSNWHLQAKQVLKVEAINFMGKSKAGQESGTE